MFYFQQVQFRSTNLQSQYDFFMKLDMNCELFADSLRISCGRTELIFELSDEQPIYHYCVLVLESGLQFTLDLLEKHGLRPIPDGDDVIIHTSAWNADSVYFYDGNDNIAEVIFHRDFKFPSSQSKEVFVQLAEVGIVDDNTDQVRDSMQRILGESPYKSSSNRFYDIGSPGAMFITIDPKQKDYWFPTKLKPQRAGCMGLINKNGITYEFIVRDDPKMPSFTIVRL